MSDGAHLGVSAGRAIKTILGGDEHPREDEQASRQELEARIRSRRLPGDGKSPWEKDKEAETRGEMDDAYSEAAEILAHCYLILTDEHPELLSKKLYYTEENTDYSQIWGKEQDSGSALWQAFTKRWPEGDRWLGGLSGFMVGWAYNAVRFIRDEPPTQNPAIA